MAILCYISDYIKKDASSHGVSMSKLESLASDVEKRQSLSGFDHFPPPCLTKKKWAAYNNRVIAVEKLVESHVVVILLRLVIRGGNDYAAFNRDPPTWAARFYDAEFDDNKLNKWVRERTEKSPPIPAPSLSDVERTFLWSSAYEEIGDDVMVCESHDWAESAEDSRIQDRRFLIPDLILTAISGPEGEVRTIRSSTDDKLSIQAINVKGTHQCLLLRAAYGETEEESQNSVDTWRERLAVADTETVLRYSRRSYPWVCCDADIWIAIQKDPLANLALSPEEAEILRLTSGRETAEAALPLFINGRAGSGKSTLLQYLFAQAFLKWGRAFPTAEASSTSPLYFASSNELLGVACDVVDSLLNAHHQQLLSEEPKDKTLLGTLPSCFQEFLQYMHRQLPEQEKSRFDWAHFVSYARFRRMWMEKFQHDKKALHDYGPQISWHVIRGLIKGMSIDGVLSKEDFDELPEDERTVSREVYETVHDRIWSAWYEPLCRNGDAWDSQDLVRLLLDAGCLGATHSAVFCDEAQDFTRLELEAIYRCSLFSNRQIDFQSVKRVPFVFAGDPFQTLNPTGFRWETVRAAFTERILRSLYRFNSRADVPQLSYRELTFNYRSSLRLVQFCNSIQAARASLFDHRSLRPQSTWQLGQESSPPAFFEKGDPQMEQALRDQSDLVLIVPCEEGEEIEFVENDPYLRQFVQFDEDGTPRNVLSAARSKGLEFLRVALYGWSQRMEAGELEKVFREPSDASFSIDDKLSLEYFLNNLYVAASRARRRLFIVDEKSALNRLWWFATDESHLAQTIKSLPRKEVWEGHVGFLVRGVPENFTEDRDDPKAIALRFEREGLAKEDSYLLRNAGQLYGGVGETVKKNECRALANLFEDRFREAASEFESAGLIDEALNALWKGKHHSEIHLLSERRPEIAKHARARMATFLYGQEQSIRGCTTLFENLLENAEINDGLRQELTDSLWAQALDSALGKAIENTDPDVAEDASRLSDHAAALQSKNVGLSNSAFAKLLFAAGRYDEVLEVLTVDDGSDVYRNSRALSLIDRELQGHGRIDAGDAKVVADYFFQSEDILSASRYYRRTGDVERLLECLRRSAEEGNETKIGTILRDTIEALIDTGRWSVLISLLTQGEPRSRKNMGRSKEFASVVLKHISNDRVVLSVVIPRLAVSDRLVSADVKSQNEVSEFLAETLLRKEAITAWWKVLPRKTAGAAIERAGKDIDALGFYEKWRDANRPASERDYAVQRWVVCKLRQAKREALSGNKNKAANYRHAAEEEMVKHGWREKDVADTFPELETERISIDRTHLRQQEAPHGDQQSHSAIRLDGRLGALTFRLFPAKGWINLQSDDGLCARILLGDKKVTSDEVSFVADGASGFRFDEWDLSVAWPSASLVRLTVGSDSKEIPFGNVNS